MIGSFYIIVILIVLVLVGLNSFLNLWRTWGNLDSVDNEKLSPFECGILEIGDARQKFDINFYLIAILFLIFDLEIILIFPYATNIGRLGLYGYIGFIIILSILIIGLIVELRTLIPKKSIK